jgi:GntR family transcriptional regulator
MDGEHAPTGPAIRPLRRTGGAPLWRQLLEDIRERLDRGEFATGFPGELELVEQYAVSRHTVREALRHLRAEGLLTVTRGRRAQLATPEPVIEQPTGVVYSLFSSVEGAGLEQVSQVRQLDIRADGVIAVRLGLEESTPLLHLERLRLAGGKPLALDRVWLPASVGEPLLDAEFTHTSLYEQLMERTGIPITGGHETVHAVIPSRSEHRTLELIPPSAAFCVERTGTSHGVPVEWRRTLIRADRFALSSALESTDPPPGTPALGPARTTPLALVPTYS